MDISKIDLHNAKQLDDVITNLWKFEAQNPEEMSDHVVPMCRHILDTLMAGPHVPSQDVLDILEKHFVMLLNISDNPTWLDWIQTPLRKSDSALGLREWIVGPLSSGHLNVATKIWDIAMSVPAHAASLNEQSEESPLWNVFTKLLYEKNSSDHFLQLMKKSLSPETVRFHLRATAQYAFDMGQHSIFEQLMERGLTVHDLDRVASENTKFYSISEITCIGSFVWMWNNRPLHNWSVFEQQNAQDLFSKVLLRCLAGYDFKPKGPNSLDFWSNAANLLGSMFNTQLHADKSWIEDLLMDLLPSPKWPAVHWMLDMMDPKHIQELVINQPFDGRLSYCLNDQEEWRTHPQVLNALIQQEIDETSSASLPRPKKM